MDKAKSEDHVIYGHQQERCYDANLDSPMCLSTRCLLEVHVKIETLDAADSTFTANESVRKMVHSQSDPWPFDRENTH